VKTKLFLIILIAGFIPSLLSAQRDRAAKAHEAYDAEEYYFAIDLYKEAYNGVKDKSAKTEIVFRIAECYRKINEPKKAEVWYKKAIIREYPNPIALLRYAEIMKMNEKYEDASNEYLKYKELVPDDPRGENGILSCQLALQWMENPSGYTVENMKYFNSRERDFSPAFAKEDYNTVYFTSSREDSEGSETHGATGQNFADIYMSKMDRKGKWSVPTPLGENINTEFEEGVPILSKDYSTLYFTRCLTSKRKKYGCDVYVARKDGDKWGKAEPMQILGDSMIFAHPALSKDELTLYFVSDIEGGVGKNDIWMLTRSDPSADWSAPVNMGPEINTQGNELFPFSHSDGTLYFSSDAHVGMGGLDIFKATKLENDKYIVENMQYPVNSFADDFGIAFEDEVEKGYFSSTRRGRGNDDIYSFVLPPLKYNVLGVVRDEKTDEVLVGAKVQLVGSDGISIESETGDEGNFKFMLRPNTDYVFIASMEGYLKGKERESTKGLAQSEDFRSTIYLSSIEKPIELPNILYDYEKWDLRPESKVALDNLVETLNDNPNITIELRSHTDSRGTESFNLDLSQKRAQSVVDYLIVNGIASDRLRAKGYGKSLPKEVGRKEAKEHLFLREGTPLTEAFIEQLRTTEQEEIAHQINRRTEFSVLSTDYDIQDK